ncbi:hypothetical protein ACN4EG_23045 [Alkalinema pantanalense CENA528]
MRQQGIRLRQQGETFLEIIELQDLLLENFPHELEIDSALWTRRSVQQ